MHVYMQNLKIKTTHLHSVYFISGAGPNLKLLIISFGLFGYSNSTHLTNKNETKSYRSMNGFKEKLNSPQTIYMKEKQ